jgi:hypothetical protein
VQHCSSASSAGSLSQLNFNLKVPPSCLSGLGLSLLLLLLLLLLRY